MTFRLESGSSHPIPPSRESLAEDLAAKSLRQGTGTRSTGSGTFFPARRCETTAGAKNPLVMGSLQKAGIGYGCPVLPPVTRRPKNRLPPPYRVHRISPKQ